MNPNSIALFQSMLVPAILVLTSSVLLFSMNGRYALVVDRIRFLRSERAQIVNPGSSAPDDTKQLSRIELQLIHLIHRIALVRVIITSYSSAVLLFCLTAILMGIKMDPGINAYFWLIFSFFCGGILALVNGVVFSVIEVFKSYRIVHIEIDEISHDLSDK